MKINSIFNEKFDVNSLNKILSMLNTKPLKIKAKTITIKELLLILVQAYRHQYKKIRNSKKGGDPNSCYWDIPAKEENYFNTSTLNFDTKFPPAHMTYFRDFIN